MAASSAPSPGDASNDMMLLLGDSRHLLPVEPGVNSGPCSRARDSSRFRYTGVILVHGMTRNMLRGSLLQRRGDTSQVFICG